MARREPIPAERCKMKKITIAGYRTYRSGGAPYAPEATPEIVERAVRGIVLRGHTPRGYFDHNIELWDAQGVMLGTFSLATQLFYLA